MCFLWNFSFLITEDGLKDQLLLKEFQADEADNSVFWESRIALSNINTKRNGNAKGMLHGVEHIWITTSL